jgi:Ca2+/Na+ antiporter
LQVITFFIPALNFSLFGFAVFIIGIIMIIKGVQNEGIAYHFSKFEQSKKDQTALIIFVVLLLIKPFVPGILQALIWLALAIIFFTCFFKYTFLIWDISAAKTVEERITKKKR